MAKIIIKSKAERSSLSFDIRIGDVIVLSNYEANFQSSLFFEKTKLMQIPARDVRCIEIGSNFNAVLSIVIEWMYKSWIESFSALRMHWFPRNVSKFSTYLPNFFQCFSKMPILLLAIAKNIFKQ